MTTSPIEHTRSAGHDRAGEILTHEVLEKR